LQGNGIDAGEKSFELYSVDSKKVDEQSVSRISKKKHVRKEPIKNKYLFNREPDADFVHLKQLEDRILKLADFSKNIEIILLNVGVVYGAKEYHLSEYFRKAFNNEILTYNIPIGTTIGSKQQSTLGMLKSNSQSQNKTSKSKFSKEKSGEDIYASNIGLINCQKLSEFVNKLCEEETPEYINERSQSSVHKEASVQLGDINYLKKNYIRLNYSRTLALEFIRLKKGIKREKSFKNDFEISSGSILGNSANLETQNQDKQEGSTTEPMGKLSISQNNGTSSIIEKKIILEPEEVNSNNVKSGTKSKTSTISTYKTISGMSALPEKKKEYFNYIDQIYSKSN
jgi:hypothetical protein